MVANKIERNKSFFFSCKWTCIVLSTILKKHEQYRYLVKVDSFEMCVFFLNIESNDQSRRKIEKYFQLLYDERIYYKNIL